MSENTREQIAVVTGASSGLGAEFVKLLDQKEYDAIWVIARRQERLEALQEGVKTPLRVLPLDLTDPASIEEISDLLSEEKPDIKILINAAGFGKIAPAPEMPLSEIDGMIELNCRAAVDMTQICIPCMGENSHIMEICSTAAFQPIPTMNIYAASKAFLYRYSRALRIELLSKKIYVTAVCPYWVSDTEFIPTAQKEGGEKVYFRHFPFASKKATVAARSLEDTYLGLAVSTPSPVSTLHRFFAKLLSSNILMGITELLRRA